MQSKTGILLINLGTPASVGLSSVKKFLRSFLMDKCVIDLFYPIRWVLVNLFIVPFRSKNTQKAYQEIWTDKGSPLLINSEALKNNLQKIHPEKYFVELGMRYGHPSIQSAVNNLNKHNLNKIIILPLYPQYASSSSGTAIKEALKFLKTKKTKIIYNFYNHPEYINALSNSIEFEKFEHLLFSFHGVPVKQLKKGYNKICYRTQCFETARLTAEKLRLTKSGYTVAFQSRLGTQKWTEPYFDRVLPELANRGIKNLSVVCPSFVSDCLETLEEIGIRAKKQWQALGGREFKVIECLNANPLWVQNLTKIIDSV